MLDFLQLLLGVLVCAMPLAVGQRLGLLSYASPMHFVGYLAFFGFTIKTFAYFVWPELAFYNRWLISDAQVGWGYAYTSGFIFFICIGYIMSARPGDRIDLGKVRAMFDHARPPVSLVTIATIALVVVTLVYIFARGGTQAEDAQLIGLVQELNSTKIQRSETSSIGQSFAFIKVFFVVPSVIFAVLLAQALLKRKPELWTFTAATVVLILIAAIIQGKRGDLIDIGIIALVTLAVLGQAIRLRHVLVGLMLVPVVLIVFSFMSVLRATRGSVDDAQLVSAEPLVGQIVGSTYFLDINAPIMITAMLRPEQMLWGSSYLSWIFAWIPRALWEDKPAVVIGPYFKNVIMQMDTGGVGGFNPTGAGEAFINFGPWGLLVALVIGIMFRRGEVYLLSAKATEKIYGPVIYATVFITLIQGLLQSSFSGIIVSCAVQAVIVYMTCRLVLQKGKSRRPAHRPRLRPR